MRSSSTLMLLSFATAILSGCVWSKNPLSDPAQSIVDEDLCGVWALTTNGSIERYVVVGRPDRGKLPPGAMVLHEFAVGEGKTIAADPHSSVFYISKLGDHEYWNLLEHPEPINRRRGTTLEDFDFAKWSQHEEHLYLFCRVERQKDRISLFGLDTEALAKIVEDGKLQGKVHRDPKKTPNPSVYLSDSTANLQKFFAKKAAKDLFSKDSEHTYQKLK